jgi:hypothetical protein
MLNNQMVTNYNQLDLEGDEHPGKTQLFSSEKGTRVLIHSHKERDTRNTQRPGSSI